MFQKLRQYGWIIGSCIVGFFILFISTKPEPKSIVHVSGANAKEFDEEEEREAPVTIAVVDVKGAVKKPGVYEVELASRVDDVIILAGGFTDKADDTHVNKAQKIHDEMVIYVPVIDEVQKSKAPGSVGGQAQSTSGVRINYATKDEITELPGIGPSKADAILQYRDEHGLFTDVDELLQVNGIGEKTLENLKQKIQIP